MFDIIYKRKWSVGSGIAAAGLATWLSASPAAAQEEAIPFGEAGIFAGYTWGPDGGGGFTWGIEGRGGMDLRDEYTCGFSPAFSAAGVARLSFVNLDPQIHFAGQAGVVGGVVSTMGEIGFGYRFGEHRGFSMPLGLELQVYAASAFFRGDPVLGTIATGGGAFIMPRDGQIICAIPGRALHDEHGHAPLPGATPLAEMDLPHDVDPDLARALASEWQRRATAEWASVPAFVQLADQLRVAGAPGALAAAALDAANDELRHAVATARAAVCFGGAPLGLGSVTPMTRAPAEGRAALVRLAVESWVDGCLGEGRAALAAARESDAAEQETIAELQAMIAVDEARHAELAWRVMAWAVREGGDDVRHALHAVRDAMPEEPRDEENVTLERFGLLPARAQRAIGEEAQARSLGRLDGVIG